MLQENKKVIVAMSGGVDSSVAAGMLVRDGYDVTGVFMRIGLGGGDSEHLRTRMDSHACDARKAADILGIELHEMDLADDFAPIVENFLDQYSRGRTPNPCIHCNAMIKFKHLIRHADETGARYVATGHHAMIVTVGGRSAIARSRASRKDQSYALFTVDGKYLDRILFPIGLIVEKSEVRDIARQMNLDVHDKPDSQEICFVADDDHSALLRAKAPQAMTAGDIVDSTGRVLGRHDGFGRFTIGQRRGVNVAAGVPVYVTRIDPQTATVTIGLREELMSKSLNASCANWHCDVDNSFDATIQIRYNHCGAPGRVWLTRDKTFRVEFDQPVQAVTPGQAAVIYDGQTLLGGGWID